MIEDLPLDDDSIIGSYILNLFDYLETIQKKGKMIKAPNKR